MKKALLGLIVMSLMPAAAADAADRRETRAHGGANVGISVRLGSGHSDRPRRHHHRAAVVRHRPVVVDTHEDVVVHDEYGDHVVVTEHRPRAYDRHEVYDDGGHRSYRRRHDGH